MTKLDYGLVPKMNVIVNKNSTKEINNNNNVQGNIVKGSNESNYSFNNQNIQKADNSIKDVKNISINLKNE